MTTNRSNNETPGSLWGRITRHRRLLIGGTVALALYALLGFFLAPRVLHTQAVKAVKSQLDADLRLKRVAINPFVLSLDLEGLELDDRLGKPVARIERIFVNFQLSSLFRWAWTFDEFLLQGPVLYLSRDNEKTLNLSRLRAKHPESPGTKAPEKEEGLPRLVIHDFAIHRCSVHWRDEVPAEPVEHDFGPITVSILDLNTLPQRPGQQSVVITTETGGILSWTGSLQLNPLETVGQASITGSDLGLLSDYIRHETGFDIVEGFVDLDLEYSITTQPDGAIAAAVEDFSLLLKNLLVKTFPPGLSPQVTQERELLALPMLKIAGGRFEWPQQVVALESLDLSGAKVSLFRDEAGMLEILRAPAAKVAEEAGEPESQEARGQSGGSAAAPWRVTLNRFGIHDLSVKLEDHSVQPVAETGVEAVEVEITGITNEPGKAFPTRISLRPTRGGTVSLDGSLSLLPEPVLDFGLKIDGVELAGAQPYVRPLADLRLDSGALNLAGRLRSSPEDPLRLEAELEVVDLLITETDEGTRIGSWDRLALKKLAFSAAAKELKISEVRLEKPYGDVLITEERQVNFGRIAKGKDAANGAASGRMAKDGEDAGRETGFPLAVTVGRVVIADASADFADRSLPLPFSAKIFNLKGNLSTISSRSTAPSQVALEGAVDKAGLVRVNGTVTPLDPLLNTDLKVVFRNVDMPKFSAYSVPFAGRKIASGRLDLDLGYKLTEKRLAGENRIILRDFELGERVEHPDALDLPFDLALALLKDSSGRIDVDLPVSGDVGDPQFELGGVIMKALGNLLFKIVTAPFAWIGKLLGVEPSDLEFVNFLPGRADLTPPEVETAGKLAEALGLRPVLVLAVGGVYAPGADGEALREARLDAVIEERIAARGAGKGDEGMYADQRRQVLEELFLQQPSLPDARVLLEELRRQHTRAPDPAKGAEKAVGGFDAVAFTADLHRRLVELQPLKETDLTELAAARAANLKAAVAAGNAGLEERIRLTDPREVELAGDVVPMKVELTAGRD